MASLFDILGLPPTAGDRDIKRAYKVNALKYHPDRPGGDPEKFKEVNEAYDLLIDEEQRAEYLKLLSAGSGANVLDNFVKHQAAQAEEQGIAKPSSKYERTCRNWARGKCNNSNCLYRHYKTSESERTKVNKVCHDYARGYCRFGDECQFLHKGADEGSPDQITTWACNDIWRNCKAENHVLQNPRRCAECGAKRKLARCKFPPDTTVKLTGSHKEILDYVKRHTLFFFRDGLYRKQLTKLIKKMSTIFMQGQMVPKVAKFYPAANCYHCVFQDGSFLIVPEQYLKRGTEQWMCKQCQYHNQNKSNKCGLCGKPNPNPVQDWSPFMGTWKSTTGDYYIHIEEHGISCSEQSHYYTGLSLRDGVLSYSVTLIEEDENNDEDSSDDEDDVLPAKLGEVRLTREGKKLNGELRMTDGRSRTTTFVMISGAGDGSSNGSESSSSFDSGESTPTRNSRLSLKHTDPDAYRDMQRKRRREARSKRRASTPPRERRSERDRDDRDRRDRRTDRDRDRDRDRGDRGREKERDRERERERERDRDRRDRQDRDRDRRVRRNSPDDRRRRR